MSQIVKILKGDKTTADGLATCLGLSRVRIVQLANEKVLDRDENSKYDLADNIQRYIAYKAGLGAGGGATYETARTAHEQLKSRLTELKLAKIENRMHDARNVELVMMEMLTNTRAQLLGLPSALCGQLSNQPQEMIYEIMTKAVEEKMTELAEYRPDMFNEIQDDEEDN